MKTFKDEQKVETASDRVVEVQALYDYSGRGVHIRGPVDGSAGETLPGETQKWTLEQAKAALVAHPMSPPIKIVSGMDAAEAKEIKEFVARYREEWKKNRNEGRHHVTPATP